MTANVWSGHSRPMRSVSVAINVRCYSKSDIIVRRSEVTQWATCGPARPIQFLAGRRRRRREYQPQTRSFRRSRRGSSWCRPPTEHTIRAITAAGFHDGQSCLRQSNYKSTLWSACACRPTAWNWQELLVAPMCSRISFSWRDSGVPWRLQGRVRTPARNFPKLRCRQRDNEIISRCLDRRT